MAPVKEPLLGSKEYIYEPSRLFRDQVSACWPFERNMPCEAYRTIYDKAFSEFAAKRIQFKLWTENLPGGKEFRGRRSKEPGIL